MLKPLGISIWEYYLYEAKPMILESWVFCFIGWLFSAGYIEDVFASI